MRKLRWGWLMCWFWIVWWMGCVLYDTWIMVHNFNNLWLVCLAVLCVSVAVLWGIPTNNHNRKVWVRLMNERSSNG